MLDLKFVRKNIDVVKDSLEKRRSKLDLDEFLKLDEQRRSLLVDTESLKAERNKTSGEIAKIKREGGDASELMKSMGQVSASIKALDEELKVIDEKSSEWLISVPNLLDQSVPVGADDSENLEVRKWGEPKKFDFQPKEHWELGADMGKLDFERAAKLTGSRFCVSYGAMARLERAIAMFMLDIQTNEHGYLEVNVPYIVNRATLTGTGQLPKFAEDLFKLEDWEYFLIPTAEVPLTNLYSGEVLTDEDMPKKFCAYTPCFRSEAGSYGKDTKGLIRQHQFHKVEMVRYARPDDSFAALEEMTGHAEAILQRLELPYRVVNLCTGDIGFSATKTYDLEVWLPGQDKYREISSCSNCTDFQARRANIKFKPKGAKKAVFVHTLNGSGLAVGRTLVAVLENYQQQDGSVKVPDALKPYMGGVEVIK